MVRLHGTREHFARSETRIRIEYVDDICDLFSRIELNQSVRLFNTITVSIRVFVQVRTMAPDTTKI